MSGILLGWPLPASRAAAGFLGQASAQASAPRGAPIRDDSEAHCLVVAPTGAGKGRSMVLPNLLHWPHSAIVVDVKGEAAIATARHRRGLGQRVHVLDPFRRFPDPADRLNPLDWLGASGTHLGDNAVTMSELITGVDAVSQKERFWDDCANDLAAGLMARAAAHTDPGQRQLGEICNLISGDDPDMRIAVMLDTERDMHPFARRQLASYMNHEADKVRPSVRSVAAQHLRIFGSPNVQAATADTSIDLEALRQGKPMTIYLVMPPTRLVSHAALMRVWLTVLLGVIAERTARPESPTLLILDEMAQIGGVQLILQSLTLLRSFGLRVMAVVQSLAQLQSLWGKDYQTVVDNCGVVAAFGQSRPAMANPMADVLGDIPVSTILQMPEDQLAISRPGQPAVVARKLDYLHDDLFKGRFDASPFYANTPRDMTGS
jgi:type IV secretion system protein VirD4